LGEKNGQFEMRNLADAYLREGYFDQERMIELIQEVLVKGKRPRGLLQLYA